MSANSHDHPMEQSAGGAPPGLPTRARPTTGRRPHGLPPWRCLRRFGRSRPAWSPAGRRSHGLSGTRSTVSGHADQQRRWNADPAKQIAPTCRRGWAPRPWSAHPVQAMEPTHCGSALERPPSVAGKTWPERDWRADSGVRTWEGVEFFAPSAPRRTFQPCHVIPPPPRMPLEATTRERSPCAVAEAGLPVTEATAICPAPAPTCPS
jgi:hypothetical protein